MSRSDSFRLVYLVALGLLPDALLACSSDDHGPTIGGPTTPVVISEGGTGVGGHGNPGGGSAGTSAGGDVGSAGTAVLGGAGTPFASAGTSAFGTGGSAAFGTAGSGGSDPFGVGGNASSVSGSFNSFSGTTSF